MKICLHHIGKRYSAQWIFRNVNWELSAGKCYSILGNNGSGKSTLLQIISGYITPSEGSIQWHLLSGPTTREDLYKHVSFCTPPTQLHSEWTISENIDFHLRFKRVTIQKSELLLTAMLENHADKKFRNLSSGMQQRLKLVLACYTDCELLLLDEPCSHLDSNGIIWYKKLLETSVKNKIVVIASNSHKDETFLCAENFSIEHGQTKFGGAS